jgi:hypothetical protein
MIVELPFTFVHEETKKLYMIAYTEVPDEI